MVLNESVLPVQS